MPTSAVAVATSSRVEAFGSTVLDRGLDQRPTDTRALQVRVDGHVLQLDVSACARRHELEVADDGTAVPGHQHAAGVQIGVELARGVLRELERGPELCSRAFVPKDLVHHLAIVPDSSQRGISPMGPHEPAR